MGFVGCPFSTEWFLERKLLTCYCIICCIFIFAVLSVVFCVAGWGVFWEERFKVHLN